MAGCARYGVVEVQQLLAGQLSLPPQNPRAGNPYPLLIYLIRHSDGPVLVDTGAGGGHERFDELYSPQDIPIADALASVGVETSEVIMIINTHLHSDHIGQNRHFPGVPIVAQRAEHEATKEEGYTVVEWLEFPGVEWRLVEGEVEVLAGIRVLPTASHTVGHQAVVIEADDRIEVIAGQAVQDRDELEDEASKEDLPRAGSEPFAVVAQRIKALQLDRVWFSHDPRVWEPG